LGSDESLGGALLSPIPWLSRRGSTASNASGTGAGSPAATTTTTTAIGITAPGGESREDGKEERGLELRSEHRTEGARGENGTMESESEKAVGPGRIDAVGPGRIDGVAEGTITPRTGDDGDDKMVDAPEKEAETVHARGPPEIGVEDTGPATGVGGVEGLLRDHEAAVAKKEGAKGETKDAEESSMDVDK
jgi:hypothetical protein